MSEAPASVDVVIPTHERPEFVRAAIASVRMQDYAGRLRVLVVFDGEEPDESLADGGPVPVVVLANDRTPGLCGARNTGIVASDAELVAFLDDDDRWLPGKIARQVDLLARHPQAVLASTSIRIEQDGARIDRLAGTDAVTHARLLESRMAMLHSSTFLLRRSALMGSPGLVDESAPRGQKEDWDLLLRYSREHPIVHLDEPLVAVRWGATSLFAQTWRSRVDGAAWILERHPDIATSPVGYARVLGQVAFAHAALGERRTAVRVAMRGIRTRPRELRLYLALLVAAGVPAGVVLKTLNRFGRNV